METPRSLEDPAVSDFLRRMREPLALPTRVPKGGISIEDLIQKILIQYPNPLDASLLGDYDVLLRILGASQRLHAYYLPGFKIDPKAPILNAELLEAFCWVCLHNSTAMSGGPTQGWAMKSLNAALYGVDYLIATRYPAETLPHLKRGIEERLVHLTSSSHRLAGPR